MAKKVKTRSRGIMRKMQGIDSSCDTIIFVNIFILVLSSGQIQQDGPSPEGRSEKSYYT